MNSETEKIVERYRRRVSIPANRYSRLNPVVNQMVHERQKALIKLFSQAGIESLTDTRVLEVGCGSGANLLELIEFGASPENLVGNDLLVNRLNLARVRLPQSVSLLAGDAAQLMLEAGSFDIVYQSTVFSSILDDALRASVASTMWRLAKPGGGVLWYDFVYDNPKNPDVRGVKLERIRSLFPDGIMKFWRVTLAPPIARRIPAWLYPWMNWAFLRTHVLCWIEKR